MTEFFSTLSWVSAPWYALALVAIIALIKAWPALKKLSMDQSAQLLEFQKQAYATLQAEITELRDRTVRAENHCIASDVRIGQLEFVLRMLMDRLEELSPGDDMVHRAKTLLPALYPVEPISDERTASLRRAQGVKPR